jgi:hypothetical protein
MGGCLDFLILNIFGNDWLEKHISCCCKDLQCVGEQTGEIPCLLGWQGRGKKWQAYCPHDLPLTQFSSSLGRG